jgi:hypothetical protein
MMIRAAILSVAILALSIQPGLAQRITLYRLVLPPMDLDASRNQAIEEIRFSVACGHIDTVSGIPDLWNVEIARAVSTVEEFHAWAGLGAAAITEPRQWSGDIVIIKSDDACFRLSGTITIRGETYTEVPLSNANLRRSVIKRQ